MQVGHSNGDDGYCEEGIDGIEEEEEDEDKFLFPSFDRLKKSVLNALYGTESTDLKDRSPKGCIDEPIRELVDLLNSHPNYATLSSCSGRIALFDPTAKSSPNMTSNDTTDSNSFNNITKSGTEMNSTNPISSNIGKTKAVIPTSNSGKGGGAWLISSHEPITYEMLEQALQNDERDDHDDVGGVLMFKHEPLLLHIAAGSLFHGRLLLSLALQLGFRESGMTMSGGSNKKLTVAIRTQSLALCVPLGKEGHSLSLSSHPTYLKALVDQANQRFSINAKKLLQLQLEIQTNLFLPHHIISKPNNHLNQHHTKYKNIVTIQNPTKSSNEKQKLIVEITDIDALPPLNIWSHASVSIPNNKNSNDDVNILVFGGYGTGPVSLGDNGNNPKKVGAKRLDTIYQITIASGQSNRNNENTSDWKLLKQSIIQTNDKNNFPANWKPTSFTAREGHAACIIHINYDGLEGSSPSLERLPNRCIAIFGGRTSPARPISQLLLSPILTSNDNTCDEDNEKIYFYEPLDIRGSPPSARWGHTMTSLSNKNKEKNNHLAIVIGGRDATNEISTVHILSMISTQFHETKSPTKHNSFFQWESLDTSVSIPRFHHVSSMATPNSSNVLVMGGIQNHQGFLPSRTSFMSVLNLQLSETSPTIATTTQSSDRNQNNHENLISSFGSAISSFHYLSTDKNDSNQQKEANNNTVFILSGGIHSSNKKNDNGGLNIFTLGDNDKQEKIVKLPLIPHHEKGLNLGSLVHHTMECIATTNADDGCHKCDLYFLGGGVDSFAFGPLFARSYRLSIKFHNGRSSIRDHLAGLSSENKNYERMQQNTATSLGKKDDNSTSSKKTFSSQNQQKRRRPVLFVHKQNAKTLKQQLEILSFLDKSYRMIPASYNDQSYIAIPVTNQCIQKINSNDVQCIDEDCQDYIERSWISLVISTGILEVPFSTKVMGRQRQRA